MQKTADTAATRNTHIAQGALTLGPSYTRALRRQKKPNPTREQRKHTPGMGIKILPDCRHFVIRMTESNTRLVPVTIGLFDDNVERITSRF